MQTAHLLNEHYATKILEKYADDNGVECNLCSGHFPVKFDLVYHIGVYHEKIKDFCTQAQADFIS